MNLFRGLIGEYKSVKILLSNPDTKPYRVKFFALMLAHHTVGIIHLIVTFPVAVVMLLTFVAMKLLEIFALLQSNVALAIKKILFIHYILPKIEIARTKLAAEIIEKIKPKN